MSLTISQQYKDVKEKAEELAILLNKLKDNLAAVTPDIDPEEEQRRTELSK